MFESAIQRKIANAFAAGCQLFDEKVPGVRNKIAEEDARSRFLKACQGKTDDSRFAAEAPSHALLLLLQEHKSLAEAVRK